MEFPSKIENESGGATTGKNLCCSICQKPGKSRMYYGVTFCSSCFQKYIFKPSMSTRSYTIETERKINETLEKIRVMTNSQTCRFAFDQGSGGSKVVSTSRHEQS